MVFLLLLLLARSGPITDTGYSSRRRPLCSAAAAERRPSHRIPSWRSAAPSGPSPFAPKPTTRSSAVPPRRLLPPPRPRRPSAARSPPSPPADPSPLRLNMSRKTPRTKTTMPPVPGSTTTSPPPSSGSSPTKAMMLSPGMKLFS